MTLEQASEIVNSWGIHMEHVMGKLNFIFPAKIPESLLPFPVETIEEAVNIIAQHHFDNGNQEAAKALQSSIGYLTAYIDDEAAITQATKNFSNPGWQNAFIPALKKFQENWSKDHLA